MATERTNLQIGEILHERYAIVSTLGKGGMGTVYLAEDLRLKGKYWAVKETPIDNQFAGQMIAEARMMIELNHPNLPQVADWFSYEEQGFLYLVREYVPGETLMNIFEQRERDLPYQSIVRYGIQLCDLLHYLHTREPEPIIYRDLKPSNVMIDGNDNVKLIDFGIARKYKEGQLMDTVQIGTTGFAAPEQFENTQSDHRTDLFSLGAMMYFLLSRGKYVYSTQMSLDHVRKDLPKRLVDCVKALVKLNPDERYQSALEVREVLESVLDENLADKPLSAPQTDRNKLKRNYVLAGVLLLSVLSYIGFDQWQQQRAAELTLIDLEDHDLSGNEVDELRGHLYDGSLEPGETSVSDLDSPVLVRLWDKPALSVRGSWSSVGIDDADAQLVAEEEEADIVGTDDADDGNTAGGEEAGDGNEDVAGVGHEDVAGVGNEQTSANEDEAEPDQVSRAVSVTYAGNSEFVSFDISPYAVHTGELQTVVNPGEGVDFKLSFYIDDKQVYETDVIEADGDPVEVGFDIEHGSVLTIEIDNGDELGIPKINSSFELLDLSLLVESTVTQAVPQEKVNLWDRPLLTHTGGWSRQSEDDPWMARSVFKEQSRNGDYITFDISDANVLNGLWKGYVIPQRGLEYGLEFYVDGELVHEVDQVDRSSMPLPVSIPIDGRASLLSVKVKNHSVAGDESSTSFVDLSRMELLVYEQPGRNTNLIERAAFGKNDIFASNGKWSDTDEDEHSTRISSQQAEHWNWSTLNVRHLDLQEGVVRGKLVPKSGIPFELKFYTDAEDADTELVYETGIIRPGDDLPVPFEFSVESIDLLTVRVENKSVEGDASQTSHVRLEDVAIDVMGQRETVQPDNRLRLWNLEPDDSQGKWQIETDDSEERYRQIYNTAARNNHSITFDVSDEDIKDGHLSGVIIPEDGIMFRVEILADGDRVYASQYLTPGQHIPRYINVPVEDAEEITIRVNNDSVRGDTSINSSVVLKDFTIEY